MIRITTTSVPVDDQDKALDVDTVAVLDHTCGNLVRPASFTAARARGGRSAVSGTGCRARRPAGTVAV